MTTRTIPWTLGVILALAMGSCANSVSWENDLHLPILDDRIRWSDVIPDSLYEASNDGSAGHFVLIDTLDGWDWNQWVELPDTVIVERYDGEDELSNGLLVVEDLEVFGYSEELDFELPGTEGMELKEASLSSGTMFLEVNHSLEGDVLLDYTLPGVTFDGVPLTISMLLTPASDLVAGSGYAEVDLSGSHFDFTGLTGLETNALVVNVSARSGPVVSEQGFYLVEATDSVAVSLGFLDVNVSSLAGYFGTLTEGTTGTVDLLDTIPLPEPVVDMEGAEASLNFSNTVAADFRLHLDTVQFDQTLVEGDFIGSHDIPRAVWVNDQPVPSVWSLDLGGPGSSFFDALETFPQKLYTSGRLTLNPYGSDGFLLDRWDIDYLPTLWYEVRVPINLGVNGVVLRDTFELEGLDEFPQFEGHLHLDFENTFPVELTSSVDFMLNDGGRHQDTLLLPAGSIGQGIVGEGTLSIPIREDILQPGGELVVEVVVNTMGPQPFTGHESVRIQGRLEGTQTIAAQ